MPVATTLHHLDDRLMFAVNRFTRATPALHGGVLDFAKYGIVLFLVLLLVGLVIARQRPSRDLAATGWAALAALLALALNQPLGHLVHEPRPYALHPQLLRLAGVTSDFSFPSDHAVMAGAVAAGLLIAHRRLGVVAALAALVMAFSRVYVAAHYPWDVVAGLLFGALVALGGWAVVRRPLVAATTWLRSAPGVRSVFGEPSTAVTMPRVEPSHVPTTQSGRRRR